MTGESEALAPADWLVGDVGVWAGTLGGGWRRHGPYPFAVQGLSRTATDLLVGTGHGLWQAPIDPRHRWVQLHDEILTEVMTVVRDASGAPVAAGSYGVSVATDDELGFKRWRSLTEELSPDERYTNVLHLEAGLWLAGTEAGVLISVDDGANWQHTDLSGSPVRCLTRIDDSCWAGTDDRGLWCSQDGRIWRQVDCPTTAVFSVAEAGSCLLVGGYDGIYCRDAQGLWQRSGPRALIRCLTVAGDVWAAGADPGGLWYSQDEGGTWRRSGPFKHVHVICGPMGGDGTC
ncbi:MAG TPA: hypothetical protein DIC52_17100 [Candidatus Latescibacteria bacterium]|nr:hypothetical protein [Candidatus Latescibacterota bacterium]|tara:strand:- start:2947 stop:3813 length:867 start_codon:yes stop_codon:yes gene_type:complete